ncbi:MAG: type II toxin-antitoxin system VapC family toxin [Bryobacteraceae bacterium]
MADSSVAIAWAVPSQATDGAVGLLNDVLTGTPFVVPVLWAFEVANSLLALRRRRVIQEEQYQRARQDLLDLDSIIDEEGPRLALEKISSIAQEHSLSVYDAVYLELALRRELPLATRDSALNKAAKSAGVSTLL